MSLKPSSRLGVSAWTIHSSTDRPGFMAQDVSPAIYNTDRFTELRGEKFPIKHLNQITMDNYIREVHDERGVMESTLKVHLSSFHCSQHLLSTQADRSP